jgi:hypothetical protein
MSGRAMAGWLPLALLLALAPAAPAQVGGEVEAGIRAYTEQGDAREAIRRIASALDAGTVPMSQRPRAHMYAAHAFLALGDTLSAMPHIERALAAHPCLLPAEELAPPAWIALYERTRPRGGACVPRAAGVVARSLVLPGWGQRTLGRSGASGYFFGATAGAALGAGYFWNQGEQRYSTYRTSTTFPEVGGLYDAAEQSRRRAVALGGAAVTLYLWNVVDAAVAGMDHDRELARVRPFALVPVIAPGASGVGIALHIPLK